MTNQPEPKRRRPGALAALCVPALLGLSGCGGSSDDSNAPPPAPPADQVTRAPIPERTPLASLRMGEQVEFPAERVPGDAGLAQAIADLASALGVGDGAAMTGLLDESSAAVLTDMLERGSWAEATDGVERVRVTRIEERDGAVQIGLGVLDGTGAYLVGWEARQAEGRWVFTGLAIEPQSALTLAELDAAPLTVRMTPVARAEEEALPAEGAEEEQPRRRGGGGRRGVTGG